MSCTGNFSGSCKTRGVLFAVFCLFLNGREREREKERERERERRIDRAGRMSLVRAMLTRTGYVT